VVRRVERDSPAWQAGLNPEDELIGLDGFRIPPGELDERLEQYVPGDSARLLIARRERLIEVPLSFGEKPKPRWKLEVDPDAAPAVKSRFEKLGRR
jgi:predicted metalloprotease with PDZ domain